MFAVGDGGTANVQMVNAIAADSPDAASDFQTATINGGAVSTDGNNNLIQTNPGVNGFSGALTITGVDPLLGTLANNGGPTQTLGLLAGSPAVNAGDNTVVANPPFSGPPYTDQRGLPRIVGGLVDLGAVESPGAGSAGQSFQFSVPTYVVNEPGAATAVVTVTRVGGTAGAVTVGYATDGGTATAGADYTATSGTLIFADGDVSKTFSIPILDVNGLPADQTVNLALTTVSNGASLGGQSTAVLTIHETAAGQTFQFSSPTYTVNDANGAQATITVTRNGGSAGAATVNYATADGTATAGTDYTATSGTLTFAPGVTSQMFTVPVLHDAAPGLGDQTVNLTLSDPTNAAALGGQSTATLTIHETGAGEFLQFGAPNYTVTEGAGTNETITVTRSGGTDGSVSVDYTTTDGTAKAGTDYTASAGTLTFAPGVSSQTFTIPLLTDGGPTGQGTVDLSLTDATNSASLGGQATAVLTLLDPQLTGLAISAPTTGVEGAFLNGNSPITNMAQFTDPGGAELLAGLADPTEYTAVVHWGDNTTSPGTAVYDGGDNFHVSAPDHIYAEEGKYTVYVTLTHDELSPVTTPDPVVTVADAPLTAGALTPPTGVIVGQAVTNAVLFHFTDADPNGAVSDYTATVTWGDGSVETSAADPADVQVAANINGGFDVIGSPYLHPDRQGAKLLCLGGGRRRRRSCRGRRAP